MLMLRPYGHIRLVSNSLASVCINEPNCIGHLKYLEIVFPQIAIAIGVLTSNTGGRATNHFGGLDVPLQGGVDVVSFLGVIAGCHSSVLWL